MRGASESGPTEPPGCNQVLLRGRIRTRPRPRGWLRAPVTLWFRLSVPGGEQTASRTPDAGDWVDCAVHDPQQRRRVRAWRVGDEVEIEGLLRRRLFRTPSGGVRSWVEIEVLRGRLVRRRL